MSRPALKYFFGLALWAAAALFAATWMGLVSFGSDVLSVAFAALVLLSLAGTWFVELIDRRLAELTRAAEEFAAGAREVRLAPAREGDELGALTRAFRQMADATDRRIATLQDSLQQTRFIAEQGPDAMWVFDVGEFRFVDVNENFALLSGYPRAQLLGKSPMDVTPPAQPGGKPTEDYLRGLIERTLRGERVVEPFVIRTHGGDDVACELRAVHVPGAGRTLLCGSLMDVRARLRTEAELTELMRFETLIIELSSTMSGLTSDGRTAAVHAALARLGEFAQVDRSHLFVVRGDRVVCEDEWCAPGIAPQIERLRDLDAASFPWFRARLAAGEVIHMSRMSETPPEAAAERAEWQVEGVQSILIVPIVAGGRVHGCVTFSAVRGEKSWPAEYIDVLKVFGEITLNALARVRAESELRAKNEALRGTVAELERSNDELQQFAYIASHDLQEPLRSISGFSDLLRKHYGDRLEERGIGYLDFISDAARRLHALIVGLLDYSRVGSRAHAFETCVMDDVLRLALDNLAAAVRESGGEVTHDPLPAVPGDPAQLTALLQNLVGNGLKFRSDRPARVHVSARRAPGPDPGWEFTVRDNGIGIAPADARKLFQIFRRLQPADKYPGTGIGLAMCKRIVERHNGRIWIEPNPEGGTRIAFTLPALARSAAA